jgi:DNA-binding transcriptional regulator PaaX
MAKTSRDAYRQIRALSEFFSTGGISRSDMERMIRESDRKKYLKQSLRRLVARGFVSQTESRYEPTSRGEIFFRRILKIKVKTILPSSWDNKWRLVTFDVPCKYDQKRNQIRSLLKEFDFYQLQKSVWICPSSVSKKFWEIAVQEDLDKYCKTMVVDIIEGDRELKEHFRLS